MGLTSKEALNKYGDPKSRSSLTTFTMPDELIFGPVPKQVTCNKDFVEPLKKSLKCLKDKGIQNELKTWDGILNIRPIRGGSSWSLHSWGLAVDVNAAENPLGGSSKLSSQFVQCFKDQGLDWGGDWTGRKDPMHFQLSDGKAIGGSADVTSSSDTMISAEATPELIKKMIELLKQKNITSEMLKKHIDKVTTGGGASFTDLDLTKPEDFKVYAEICDKFIANRPPNLLNITGEMLANGAKKAMENGGSYVPPELSLAQLAAEGGIGNKDPQSRPIRTKNPFNVGNVDSGANIYHGGVQSGIDAYYNLVSKRYLGNGKTASDLAKNFVNHRGSRYASAPDYENAVTRISQEANNIANQVIAKKSNTSSNVA
jgi:hypothetical protein